MSSMQTVFSTVELASKMGVKPPKVSGAKNYYGFTPGPGFGEIVFDQVVVNWGRLLVAKGRVKGQKAINVRNLCDRHELRLNKATPTSNGTTTQQAELDLENTVVAVAGGGVAGHGSSTVAPDGKTERYEALMDEVRGTREVVFELQQMTTELKNEVGKLRGQMKHYMSKNLLGVIKLDVTTDPK